MNPNRSNRTFLALIACGVSLSGLGCAGHTEFTTEPTAEDAVLAFDAGSYPAVFEAAMDTLTEMRFTPDRVDAARGVITTFPKSTAGLATPWDREQSNLGDEGRDFVHQHERVCRIVFEPSANPTAARIEVVIMRVRRPGWRIETDAIGRSSHAINPEARTEGDEPEFRDPIGTDAALAARLRSMIAERAGTPKG